MPQVVADEGLMPKLALEKFDYKLIRDDIVSVEPISVELKWDMSDKEFEEYKKAASRLLKSNQEFLEESLRRFLKKNNILVYPLDEVVQLLKHKSGRSVHLCYLSEEHKKLCGQYDNLVGLVLSKKAFQHFVPLRVIKRVDSVLKEFPDLDCFISDYKNASETFVIIAFGINFSVSVIDMWDQNKSALAREEK
ncbi:MAG: hypothetical protein Q8R55_01985 [Candidatus Taylorbacteria bacterium]|nr:hypothetical protein [Candidatus Taylorbacteria bacterium]